MDVFFRRNHTKKVNKKQLNCEKIFIRRLIAKNEVFTQNCITLMLNFSLGQILTSNFLKYQIIEFGIFLLLVSADLLHSACDIFMKNPEILQKLIAAFEKIPEIYTKLFITLEVVNRTTKHKSEEKISIPEAIEKILFFNFDRADDEIYLKQFAKIIGTFSIKPFEFLSKFSISEYSEWLKTKILLKYINSLNMIKPGNIHNVKYYENKKICASKILNETTNMPSTTQIIKNLQEIFHQIMNLFDKSVIRNTETHFLWTLIFLCGSGYKNTVDLLINIVDSNLLVPICKYLGNLNTYFPKLFMKAYFQKIVNSDIFKNEYEKIFHVCEKFMTIFIKDPKWLKWLLNFYYQILSKIILPNLEISNDKNEKITDYNSLIPNYEIIVKFMPKISINPQDLSFDAMQKTPKIENKIYELWKNLLKSQTIYSSHIQYYVKIFIILLEHFNKHLQNENISENLLQFCIFSFFERKKDIISSENEAFLKEIIDSLIKKSILYFSENSAENISNSDKNTIFIFSQILAQKSTNIPIFSKYVANNIKWEFLSSYIIPTNFNMYFCAMIEFKKKKI